MARQVQAPGEQELEFVAEPDAVGRARRWLSTVAIGHVEPSRVPDLAIVTTEIVANAVRHGAPRGEPRLAATPKSSY
jgi:anti-sigma regulatory factor (Ser/Thr protein kinase)